jgi:hypothetical protein
MSKKFNIVCHIFPMSHRYNSNVFVDSLNRDGHEPLSTNVVDNNYEKKPIDRADHLAHLFVSNMIEFVGQCSMNRKSNIRQELHIMNVKGV